MFKIADVILKRLIISPCLFLLLSIACFSQPVMKADSSLTLGQCIDYALKHQPFVNQALINEAIVRTTNAINQSSWYPQVNAQANLTHYNSRPTSYIVDSAGNVHLQKNGVVNTFIPVLGVSQTIFNPALLYATRSAPLFNQQAQQITDSTKIDIVAGVSKTFYGLLLTLEQISVLKEDTARLAKNVSDAYHQYVGGIVDETDYDEAVISLNNSKFQLKQATENLNPQYAMLKQVMGYPPRSQFNVLFDTVQMMNDIAFDTTQELQFEKRIEYKFLQTQKALQLANINYYRNAWMPTVGAFFNYDYEFQSNGFGDLFSKAYPYSYMGLSLTMPIFTGFNRTNNIKRARLQGDLLDWSEVNLKSQIYTEYATALANYKSNYFNLGISKENVSLARRTYDIVALQYQQGVVPYLNVITAESNLITSEISYQNALFQVLSSKIDLQKSMGFIVVH
ncbi:TolC family protein [Puia sp.]|uniref:TolC family protein n=1 Tax=Puia sp. TaxID=2045100 RepID=UPI002F4055A9